MQLPSLRREAFVLAACLGFGLLLLPALIYLVGERLLGEYRPDAGMGAFYADLYAELASMSAWAWLLVLGPWLAIQSLRMLWLPFTWLERRMAPQSGDDHHEPDDRPEPMI